MLRHLLARLLWRQPDAAVNVMRDINANLARMNETLDTMTGVLIAMHEEADASFADSDPETDVGLS